GTILTTTVGSMVFCCATNSFLCSFGKLRWSRFMLVGLATLLLCAIAVRGDKLIVIKDSEAIQYVGQEVEGRGCVVCLTTSPLVPYLSLSEENIPVKRLMDTLRPGPK